jgi:hypothetical protein
MGTPGVIEKFSGHRPFHFKGFYQTDRSGGAIISRDIAAKSPYSRAFVHYQPTVTSKLGSCD